MPIIKYRKTLIGIGLGIMILSAVVVGSLGLNLGIDFTGGALTEVTYDTVPDKQVIEETLTTAGLTGFSLRETVDDAGRSGYILRSKDLNETERESVTSQMVGLGEGGTVTRFASIGPVIGQELKDKAIWAIGAVVLVIVLYVAFAFLGVGRPVSSWVYGVIAIFVLVHDVLVPTALMSLLGHFLGVEVDVLFVMALLAVLGYSVNDTIVVFDRVRENLVRYRQEKKRIVKNSIGEKREEIDYIFNKPFADIVGESVSDTLLRSVNTSLTTFLALLALYLFGGAVTQTFALILMAGVVAGTYSSVALASPLLVWWSERNRSTKTTN